jgi:hypothetical protein
LREKRLAGNTIIKRSARLYCISLCLSLAAFAALPKTGLVPALAQTTASSGTEACLKCHGPFDKLAGTAARCLAPSGEKINPHMYVPHASREAHPQCTNCHEPHPLPPKAADSAAQPKPGVQWCYTACHHKNTFEPCKNCHK